MLGQAQHRRWGLGFEVLVALVESPHPPPHCCSWSDFIDSIPMAIDRERLGEEYIFF